MTISILVTLPDMRELSVADKRALHWAGVTDFVLRASFRNALWSVLNELFPEDTWRVVVREASEVEHPRFTLGRCSARRVDSEKLSWAVNLAALAWRETISHISIIRYQAAKNVRRLTRPKPQT